MKKITRPVVYRDDAVDNDTRVIDSRFTFDRYIHVHVSLTVFLMTVAGVVFIYFSTKNALRNEYRIVV